MRLEDMYPVVLTIVLIGLVLGIGLYVMSEVRTAVATDYSGTDYKVNVSRTVPTNTTTLNDSTKDDYALSAITVINQTEGTTVDSGEYTFTAAGVITWSDLLAAETTDWHVNISSTYIYDASGSAEEGINDSVEGLAGFAGWIAVIIVVIAAAIVLGIVLRSFGRRSPGV